MATEGAIAIRLDSGQVSESEVVGVGEVHAWVEELKKTLPKESTWELRGVLDETAPNYSRADEGVVVRSGGRIAGATLISGSDPPAVIGRFVLPEFRNMGLGGKLMEKSVKRLLERGVKKVIVESCDTRALRSNLGLPPELLQYIDLRDARRDE